MIHHHRHHQLVRILRCRVVIGKGCEKGICVCVLKEKVSGRVSMGENVKGSETGCLKKDEHGRDFGAGNSFQDGRSVPQ
jgi:hypothetical protein